MKAEKKKVVVIAAIGGLAIVGFLVFAFFILTGGKGGGQETVEVTSAKPVFPDAKEDNLIESKTRAYSSDYASDEKSKGIEDIWASLASDSAGDSSGSSVAEQMFGSGEGAEESQQEIKSGGRRRDVRSSDESRDLVVSQSSTTSSVSPSAASRRVSSASSSSASQKKAPAPSQKVAQVPDPVEPEPVPEPAPEPKKPQRTTGWNSTTSGVISSLDDAVEYDDEEWDTTDERFIRCCFAKDVKIRSGQRITVRLLENLFIDEALIPANSRITAMCTLSERLDVVITGFELNGKIYEANFTAFDINDGKQGIYCSVANDQTSKRAQREAVSSAAGIARDAMSYTGVLGRIGASAIGVAQSAGQQKISLTEVSIPAGYEFYIKRSKR